MFNAVCCIAPDLLVGRVSILFIDCRQLASLL